MFVIMPGSLGNVFALVWFQPECPFYLGRTRSTVASNAVRGRSYIQKVRHAAPPSPKNAERGPRSIQKTRHAVPTKCKQTRYALSPVLYASAVRGHGRGAQPKRFQMLLSAGGWLG